MVPRLNIVGCGKVGRAIGRLWFRSGTFRPGGIANARVESSRRAVEFLGAGAVVESFGELPESDVTWIAANDDALAEIARRLAAQGAIRPGDVVFHSSGALAASVLGPLADLGAFVASVHPLRSFADPAIAATGFAGTWCGCEGDGRALEILEPAFRSIGGRTFAIASGAKPIYHASAVFASNYLVALVEVAVRCGREAGIDRETTLKVLGPLMRGTLDNIDELGPAGALTGPIARGDARFVADQERALRERDPQIARLYREMGRVAAELAREKGETPDPSLDEIAKVLGDP
ncbi:MAG: Rossmann-like and DUF2520 domain-containing protein [Isosphaeraceae bacterium]